MKTFNKVITIIIFIFLYIPIIVLAVASFSSGTDLAVFKEFTFDRYADLFADKSLLLLVKNSFLVAIISTAAATVYHINGLSVGFREGREMHCGRLKPSVAQKLGNLR